ncbi:mechanosensitive ion channel family protein [Sulfitobacter sp. SK012]|uniref:mechanosensitive ion channel family protein n=1 Tax=Sulfitobacter sp. SK012 TaxID=1389005 RepID=UPI000E0C5C00|nr:mechanosensitive ion channel family protein [Sulfitobacter sp. SK012]AXI45763.1 mechanosensitive ion channel family protein [Sulfitobacter sp. SK012]
MKFAITRTILAITLVIISAASWAQDTASTIPPAPDPASLSTNLEQLNALMVPMTSDDLAELADVWQGHLKSSLEEVVQLNLAIEGLDGAQATALRERVGLLADDKNAVQDRYAEVLESWTRKGAPPEDVAKHTVYISALNLGAVRTTDPRTLFRLGLNWVTARDGGLGFMLKIGGFVLAIWVMMFLARIFKRAAQRGLDRLPSVSRLLRTFIVNAVYWATFVLGILLVLSAFGVNVTPLFAVFGGLSFILGFALQDTLGNLASGLMIMILKPFDMGDFIEVSGASGVVDEMSIVSTQIRTFDNQIIVVPNSKIWGNVITNVSASPERRVDLVFGIAYTDKASHAISVLNELVKAHKLCISDPAPEIFVGELGDSSVNIFCRPWCKTEDYWIVYWDLTGQAKERFDEEGISIPFPQRDVHLIQT